MHPEMQTEKRLYVDGLWLARHAAERLDASFNWVDVAALARRAGGGAPINACYFAIFDPQDPQSASPARALIQALESQGVTCVVREEPAPPQECTRCGHGWEHYPDTLLGVDLALAVAGDAASGAVDEAVVITDPATFAQIQRHFVRCHPHKQVSRFVPSAADLRSARLGRSVSVGHSITLLRPDCWAPAGKRRAARPSRFADMG